MSTHAYAAPIEAACQPPPPGVRDERLDALLADVMAAKHPPTELVNRCLDAICHADRVGARAMIMAELAASRLLWQLAGILAEAADDGDPYDVDLCLRRDAEGCDDAVALSMLLRSQPYLGQRLSDALTRYLEQRAEPWLTIAHRDCVDVAETLLLAVRRMRG